MIFVHFSKSAHAIGQNRSRVFWLPGNNESFECVLTITYGGPQGTCYKYKNQSLVLYLKPSESYLKPSESYLKPSESYLKPSESYLKPSESYLSPSEFYVKPFRILCKALQNFM